MIKEVKPTQKKTTRTAKVFALSLGGGLSMIAQVVFAMVAARYLSKHDYATIKQTFLAYQFAAPLLMLGLPSAIYYFLPREQEMKRGVIVDNITLLVCVGLIFSLFIAFGGNQLLAMRFNNPDLQKSLSWLVVYPLIMMPVASFAGVMVWADRTKLLASYNVLSNVSLTIAGIIAILYTKSYTMPILVRVVIPSFFLPIAIGLMFYFVPGAIRWPRMTSMWNMLCYSVPLGLASMLGSITIQMQSIIVAALCSPEDFAVYINGAMEIPLIRVITGSITMVILSDMSNSCATGDKAVALNLFRKASIKSACILLPTMCFLLTTAKPFILFLYSEQYRASVLPFIIYLFELPVRIVTYGAALMALGMTSVILVRSIITLIVNAILCYVLVKIIGYIGAAVAIVLTHYFCSIPLNLYKISQGFGVPWTASLPLKTLFKILTICVLCMPLAALGAYTLHIVPLGQLSFAAVLYWPIVIYLLYRKNLFVLPLRFERFIPSALRVQIR